MDNLAFLFGAGISKPAGLPLADAITFHILTGEDINRYTDETYHRMPPLYGGHFLDEYKPRSLQLIRTVKEHTDQFLKIEKRESTYEDIFSVLQQLYDSETGEYENPIAQPFIGDILKKLKPILRGSKKEFIKEWRLIDLLRNSIYYIIGVIGVELYKPDASTNYLNFIGDSLLSNPKYSLDIFTLNYDSLISKYLKSINIDYFDGFSEPIEGVRYYKSALYESNNKRVNYIKLHGDFRWYDFFYEKENRRTYCIGNPIDGDRYHHSFEGCMLHSIEGIPKVLVGTLNKAFKYNDGIFFDMQCFFNKRLRQSSRLIVSGYSFNDKIINSRIIEWFSHSESNKLIIIHKKPDLLLENARPAVQRMLEHRTENPNILVIEKWIEEISWQEIKKFIV